MGLKRKPRAIILTISDSASRHEREDLSGPTARHGLEQLGCEVLNVLVLPDELDQIKGQLVYWSDKEDVDLVVTSGGTGLSARDVTPEATVAVVEKEVPGLAELLRIEGMKSSPRAVLSRAVAGIRARTLIVNLPGSVRGVTESLQVLAPVLTHALEVVSGNSVRCGDPSEDE